MVEVFKTNVRYKKEATELLVVLSNQFPDSRVNFDLEDTDKILRVEAAKINPDTLIEVLETHGFNCQVLE